MNVEKIKVCKKCGSTYYKLRCTTCYNSYMRSYNNSNKEKCSKRNKRYKLRHPDICKNSVLKVVHGITLKDYNILLESQDGTCAICGNEETGCNQHGILKFLSVDHDHTTGIIRGLLCKRCNLVLGQIKDSIDLLNKMKMYLKIQKR
jgi:hypothetical protein